MIVLHLVQLQMQYAIYSRTKFSTNQKLLPKLTSITGRPVLSIDHGVRGEQCRATTLCQQEKQLMLSAAGKGQRTGGVHDRQDGDHCHFKLLNLVGMRRAAA